MPLSNLRLLRAHLIQQRLALTEAAAHTHTIARELAVVTGERDAQARHRDRQRAVFLGLTPRLFASRSAQTLAAQQALRAALSASLAEDDARLAALEARARPVQAAYAAAHDTLCQRFAKAKHVQAAILAATKRQRLHAERRHYGDLTDLASALTRQRP
jgi:hypothetical protein